MKIFSIISLTIGILAANPTYGQTYDFKFIANQWLKMSDGVKLSVNYWQPISKKSQQRFPIVLEVLPYRKDDIHLLADYPIGAYFAKQGIGFARVDIRGTGSSEGDVPDREYSDQELQDIQHIIAQLAKLPWCNGNIGMQGISWSAFNSMMTAMRAPVALKGILVAHGSDDLYANDIHNIDGALHIDIFSLEIETDNLLPQSPDYRIDNNYFKKRFNQKPWIFAYLKHQRDGAYWQINRSLRSQGSAIKIPVLAFASLLDGYRDFAINMLNQVRSPLRVFIGPQNHAWPNALPGPRYEWRQLAVRYWQQVLNGQANAFWHTPALTAFMREPKQIDEKTNDIPGFYWQTNWPVPGLEQLRLTLATKRLLSYPSQEKSNNSLVYKPNVGRGVLNWWGEITPNMQFVDKDTLTYDSEPLKEDFYLIGNPEVRLMVAANAPLVHWIVRLEDIHPDGSISLITGGLKNATQRLSRANPRILANHKFFELTFPLHFSTWHFVPGHRIRIAISNGQFPMIWPTPYPMITQLKVGGASSELMLPIIRLKKPTSPKLPPLAASEQLPGVKYLVNEPLTPFKFSQDRDGNSVASAKENYEFLIHKKIIRSRYQVHYRVNNANPGQASFVGEGEDTVQIKHPQRQLKVWAKMTIRSDLRHFHTEVRRKIFANNKLVGQKSWKESISRDFQ